MKDQILEAKIGFDKIRRIISDRCLTDYAVERVAGEEFSNDAAVIERRLRLTDEMRLVMMFEENFPTTGYIDTPFLDSLAKPGSCIDVLSLGKLKTATDTIRRILHFFGSVKDGVYPELKRLAGPVRTFPEIAASRQPLPPQLQLPSLCAFMCAKSGRCLSVPFSANAASIVSDHERKSILSISPLLFISLMASASALEIRITGEGRRDVSKSSGATTALP